MIQVHPEVAEAVSLPSFTHWLLFPETSEYYAFIKAVAFDRHTNKERLKEKGIQFFTIGSRPQGYPTKPEYKTSNQCSSQSLDKVPS